MSTRVKAAVTILLLALNLVALNALLKPVARARLDMTEAKEYTISDATRETLSELPDEVTIYGYFSERTHELLRPLIPKVRDLLEEYRVYGEGRVVVHFLDPRDDEEVEEEAYQRFGVRPIPVPLAGKYEAGVQSVYFHIVVRYGDQHQTLGLQELIDTEATPARDELIVKLGNLEYQLTSAIHRSIQAFGRLEARVAELPEPVLVTGFVSRKVGGEGVEPAIKEEVEAQLAEHWTLVEGVFEQLEKRFEKNLEVKLVDPSSDEEALRKAQRIYGLQPLLGSPQGAPLYAGIVVHYKTSAEQVPLGGAADLSAGQVIQFIEGSLRRLVPGALKRVGLVSAKPDIPPEELMRMQMAGQQPPGDDFTQLRAQLGGSYEVKDVKLDSGTPPDVDVLILLRPEGLSEKAAFALDQYLMLGKPAIVLADATQLDASGQGIQLKPIETGLRDLLAHYGVQLERQLIQDQRSLTVLLPRMRQLGGLRIRELVDTEYPWFLNIRDDGIAEGVNALAGVERVGLLWASPLKIDRDKQPQATWTELLRTSDGAWATADMRDVPVPEEVTPPEATSSYVVAALLEGQIESYYADKAPPSDAPAEDADADKDAEADPHDHGAEDAGVDEEPASLQEAAQGEAGTGEAEQEKVELSFQPFDRSVGPARLLVIADADFVSDFAAARVGQAFADNAQMMTGLVDWALADVELIGIRSRGTRSRPLEELDKAKKQWVEGVNYAIPFALVLLFGVTRLAMRQGRERRGRRGRPDDAGSEDAPTPDRSAEVQP